MIVYYEKQVPNLYDGDLEDEDEILKWLLSQLENDEIEDVTDEMLDKLIKEGNEMLVLFCKFIIFKLIYPELPNDQTFNQTITMTKNLKRSWASWKISTTNVIKWVFYL